MKSWEEIVAIKDKLKLDMEVRHELDARRVIVGMGTCGIKAGARDIMAELMKEFAEKNIEHTMLTLEGCIGKCDKEPVIEVIEKNGDKVVYGLVDKEKVKKIVDSHLLNDKAVSEFTL